VPVPSPQHMHLKLSSWHHFMYLCISRCTFLTTCHYCIKTWFTTKLHEPTTYKVLQTPECFSSDLNLGHQTSLCNENADEWLDFSTRSDQSIKRFVLARKCWCFIATFLHTRLAKWAERPPKVIRQSEKWNTLLT